MRPPMHGLTRGPELSAELLTFSSPPAVARQEGAGRHSIQEAQTGIRCRSFSIDTQPPFSYYSFTKRRVLSIEFYRYQSVSVQWDYGYRRLWRSFGVWCGLG